MNIQREITPDRDVMLTIEVEADTTAARLASAFLKFQREAHIPGFRPGKVPLDLIRKRYGKDIIADALDLMTREALAQALEREKLDPAGRIHVDHLEKGERKPLRFTARFPLRPEPRLTSYKGLRVLINDAEVSDDDVEAQLESLRRKHAHLHSIESPAPASAVLTVKVKEVHPSGLQLLGRPVEEKQIEFGADQLGAGTDEQLLGIKVGETRVIHVRADAHGVTGAPASGTILTPQQAAQQEERQDGFLSYSVEAIHVEVPRIPDLDYDFAQEINPNLKSVDDLRQYTRLSLMGYVAAGAQQALESALIGRLIEENPFPVPRGIISATLEEVAVELKLEGDARRQFTQEHYREAERDYRWVMLRDEIAKVEGIEVADEELDQEMARIAERSGETIAAVSMRFSPGDKLDRLRGRLFERRVLQFLAENAEIERRKMDLGEFLRMGEG